MSLNLNQSNVSLDNHIFNPMLTNLQANILKFHGRKFAHHLFIQFKTEKIEEAKKWIIYFTSSKITNAYTQLYDSAQKKLDNTRDGGTIYTLSLSNYGYKTLKINSSIRQNKTFDNGLHASAGVLRDKFENWEDKFRTTQIDMLIIAADDNAATAFSAAQKIIDQISSFATCVINQRGNVLKMAATQAGIEHFGYADGISQPMYLADEINSQPPSRIWDDTTNLDMLLVEEKDGTENCFGSYLVFRKLEQNVKGFKDAEGDNGITPGKILIKVNGKPDDVMDDQGIKNQELAGAMIVGRFENSMPVTKSGRDKIKPTDPDPDDKHLDNNFDYSNDLDALKCPFHAHIRLVNPRKGNIKQDPVEIRSHRITRRGIPYDDNNPKRISDDKILKITDEMLEANQPTGKAGLLFMCYQSDIKSHFEELQGQWANTGIIDPATISIGEDSLISQGNNLPRTLPQQWGKPLQCDPFQFHNFITMRGGEYFYTPSISFLKNL